MKYIDKRAGTVSTLFINDFQEGEEILYLKNLEYLGDEFVPFKVHNRAGRVRIQLFSYEDVIPFCMWFEKAERLTINSSIHKVLRQHLYKKPTDLVFSKNASIKTTSFGKHVKGSITRIETLINLFILNIDIINYTVLFGYDYIRTEYSEQL